MLTEAEWERSQQHVVVAWHQGDVPRALSEIDRVLAEGTDEMKGQSLIYRGMIQESQGSVEAANRDWKAALSYTAEGSYGRYVAQRSLGSSFEKLGLRGEAERWYRAALETCVSGKGFSGGLALKRFMALKAGTLSKKDRALVFSAVKRSWKALDIAGKPDLTDLNRVVDKLASKASDA